MRLGAMRLGAVFTLLAVGMLGCDSLNEPVAPEQNTRVERNDRDNGPPGNDDDAATVYVVHGINGTDL
nr:hypothetical protein [Candidatus Palauibacterales bacterium]